MSVILNPIAFESEMSAELLFLIPSHLCLKYAWFLILLIIAETSDQQREQEKEEKKKYLLRKLSFRPSVDELKTRKVGKIVHTSS